MLTLLRDLRVAARGLARTPGYALIAVATIALGIGAATAIFSLVRGVLLRDLPFPDSDRLAVVWERAPQGGSDRNPVNPGNYLRWRERSRSFATLSAFVAWPATLGGAGVEPERLPVAYVASDFFDTIGVPMRLGRGFLPEEGTPGHDGVAILSEALWRRRFGADPGVVGRALKLDGDSVLIVGVAAAGLEMPTGTQVWNPIAFSARHLESRGRSYSVVGRLRPGVTIAAAEAEMSKLGAGLALERPDVDAGWGVTVLPLREHLVGGMRLGLFVLLGAVGTLLSIACANLAHLGLIRGAAREREFALRSALGGGGAQLLRVPLAEALLLGAVGGVAGIAVARAALVGLLAIAPTEIPRFVRIELDTTALAFALVATLVVALSIAALPAWRAARANAASLLAAARATRPDRRLRGALAVAEIALALVLLVSASLLSRSLVRLETIDPGFSPGGVSLVEIDLPPAMYREEAKVGAFFARLVERARGIPGVERAAAVSWLPFGGMVAATTYHPADEAPPRPGEEPVTEVRTVTPGLFTTLGLELRRGRDFDAGDDARAPKRAVISESIARRYFQGRDPIGASLEVAYGAPGGIRPEIIGVVADARLTTIDAAPRDAVYLAEAQTPLDFMTLALRSSLPPAALESSVRTAVHELDPQVAVPPVRTLANVAEGSLRRPRFTTFVLVVFAAAALLLAALGVYGVIAYGVAQRSREIGVRVAVGATRGDVFRLVLGDGFRLVAMGSLLGLAGAWALSRTLGSLLYEIPAWDPASFAAASAILAAAALAACLVPARRAVAVDPAIVLREG